MIVVATVNTEDVVRLSQLPDPNDIETSKELRCSACRSSESIIKSHLVDALEELQHHAAADENSMRQLVAAAAQGTCEHEQRHVGLLRTAALGVTTEFKHELLNDFRGDLVKAGWISEVWADECTDTMHRMKPHFLDFAMRKEIHNWCPVCLSVAARYASPASSRPTPYSRSMRIDEL